MSKDYANIVDAKPADKTKKEIDKKQSTRSSDPYQNQDLKLSKIFKEWPQKEKQNAKQSAKMKKAKAAQKKVKK